MREVQYFVCILLCVQFTINAVFTSDDTILLTENIESNDILSDFEWKCNVSSECTAIGSVCSNYLCKCIPGYVYNSDMTACIKVATRLHDSCEETVQCSAYLLSGARCINNTCVCAPGYYYLHGRCNRYVGLFENCTLNSECYVNADFEATICDTLKGICKCRSGFYQREHRTCRREGKNIGDPCTVDIDCTFKNAYCNKYACDIKPKSENDIDLPLDTVILVQEFMNDQIRVGSNCTTNEECAILGKAICGSTGTCLCDRAHFAFTETKCIPELGEPCQSNDISDIKRSTCREGKWACMTGRVPTKDNQQCLKAIIAYNKPCHENEQCYVFGPDAICNNKRCICNENSHYVESELFCWMNKAFGEKCIQDQDCYVKGFKGELFCKNNTCNCPDGKRLNKKGLTCIDNSTELGGACETNIDCVTPNSVCKKEVCVCADSYFQSNKKCLAGIKSKCNNNNDCAAKNSMCTSNVCSCKPDYAPAATDLCMRTLSYGEACSLDMQCFYNIPRAVCRSTNENNKNTTETMESPDMREIENKVCTCEEKDHYIFGKCFTKRSLGEICTNRGQCYISSNQERVICMNGKCKCDWGYMKSNNNVCVRDLQSRSFINSGVTNSLSTKLLAIIACIILAHNLTL